MVKKWYTHEAQLKAMGKMKHPRNTYYVEEEDL